MTGIDISIRLDHCQWRPNRLGQNRTLGAIRAEGSITGAARYLGMSYRRAWLLVRDNTLKQAAIITTQGGANGSGAAVTPVGQKRTLCAAAISSDRWARSPQLLVRPLQIIYSLGLSDSVPDRTFAKYLVKADTTMTGPVVQFPKLQS